MINRNKQQYDIMYNMVFDFAIHGIAEGQKFFTEITSLAKKYGDAVRLVGFNTKKPTARVNTSVLYSNVLIPIEVLDKLPDTDEEENNNADTDTSNEVDESEDKEEGATDDQESTRTN